MEPDVYEYRNWEKNSCAVIFIHGFTGDKEKTWGKFPEYLLSNQNIHEWDIFSIGYPTSLAPDIKGGWAADPDIPKLALSLKTKISHEPFQRYEKFAFIAHSMGGLIVQRALLDSPEMLKKTRHVFLFGTPSGGLGKAGIGKWFKSQSKNMAKDSEFIISLRKDWDNKISYSPDTFHFKVIAGERDEFVGTDSSHAPFPKELCEVIPGNHLEIVKPDSAKSLNVQIVLKGLGCEVSESDKKILEPVATLQKTEFNQIQLSGMIKVEMDKQVTIPQSLSETEKKFLQQKFNEMQKRYEMVSENLASLTDDYDNETRSRIKLQLKREMDREAAERDKLEKQLTEISHKLNDDTDRK